MMAQERFWSKVDKTGDCWLWTACLTTSGYGQFSMDGHSRMAHVVAYEWSVGPVPQGLQLDHTCHSIACNGGVSCPHRRCVNPAHLEPVTNAENRRRGVNAARRKTHCPRGHPYIGDNLRVEKSGKRHCRTCDFEFLHGRPVEYLSESNRRIGVTP